MINRIVLLGRLTAEPEVKQTQSGISQLNFNIAVERNKANRDGNRQTAYQVVVEQVSFAGGKSDNAPEQPQNQGYHAPPAGNQGFGMGEFDQFEEIGNEDDLPF